MPYNSRKTSYRRRRRFNRSLTTKNIFSRTKAKNQARQIYALRKRVSAISQRFRPEVKTTIVKYDGFDLDSSAYSSSYSVYTAPLPETGGDEAHRIGDFIKVKNLNFYISMEYYNNSPNGYHDSESAGSPVRIIVVQSKHPLAATYQPALNVLLRQSGYTGEDYTLRSVSPYNRGVNEDWTILYDKGFYLTTAKNQLSLTIQTKPSDMQWNADSQTLNSYIFIVPSGLHHDTNFTEHIHGVIMAKLAYTDA